MTLPATLVPPVTAGSRADEVVQRLSEAISLGLLNDGERLPAEPDLAAQFGVAPMTVREALAALRELGLVETRRGRSGGSFVKRLSSPPVEPQLQRLTAMTLSDLRDLADEHRAVAGQAAWLAAQRASAVNVRRLFGLTEQLGAAATRGDQIRADCRFHIEVTVAAHSSRLTRREVSLQAEVSGLLWLPVDPGVDVAAMVAEHHGIAAAVVSEDAEGARRLAEAHVDGHLSRLTALHLQLTSDGVVS
ncbi:FadR/GntR family transcriptional regulator [Nocardioides marmoribigeumensis]|jgi:DNA-binding FadR family transcriptional regulator|uniref:DNA-binding FadR family transcriptional regulator n=1 Tax=Nocardioides marmoribigeumensis TaxID=433649 RepID=A0ABU2BXQ4_9ACTN|nr:GntR family transcriptional regulator [Nocardioides marmoribigeumensis]MDR7363164.1 DNA-binding FadR family transcriptional regulator [Nocardioides marmoribigeumensis]